MTPKRKDMMAAQRTINVEALQWLGDSTPMRLAVRDFVHAPIDERRGGLQINLNGRAWTKVMNGDWIVKLPNGAYCIVDDQAFTHHWLTPVVVEVAPVPA
jgi:hypothetical protein